MQDKKKKKHRDSLLLQTGAALIILFIITIILNGIAIFRGSSTRYQARQLVKVKDWAIMLQSYFDPQDNGCTEWLVRYWTEHCNEVDPSGADDAAMLKIAYGFGKITAYDLTKEELSSLSGKDQKVVADTAYQDLKLMYDTKYPSREMETEKIIMRAFLFMPDDQAFILVSSDPYERSGDTGFYEYGDLMPFALKNHPAAMRVVQTGEAQEDLEPELSDTDRKVLLRYYTPIIINDRTEGLIEISIDATENFRNMWRNSAGVEKFNLIALVTVAFILLQLIYLLAVKPLRFIQENLRSYMADKDSGRIVRNMEKIHSHNEFKLLAEDMTDLVQEMDRYIEEVSTLAGERERKNTELSIARDIQLQNLPRSFPAFPDRKEFDVYATMDAAWGVGGDFYDFFLIDDDHLALVMADVSGKGVPAAMFMMMVKTRLKNIAMSGHILSPAQVLNRLNNELAEGNEKMVFVSLWLGIFTISEGYLCTSNGGHENPFVLRSGEGFEEMEEEHGLVLGINPDHEYSETGIDLKAGEMVFIYTDGITEAMSSTGELFGKERMSDTLNRLKDEGIQDILKGIRKEVDDFTGTEEMSDDLTMLIFKVETSGSA